MTSIPVPDFANATKVCFLQIIKDSPGVHDRAKLGKHYKAAPPSGKKPGFLAKKLAKGTVTLNPGNGQVTNDMPTDLSIKVEGGTNLYMIGLDAGTGCRFGPSPHPIHLLPLEYTNLILKDVGLIFVDATGSEQFIPAADIAANFGTIPASAMLAFTLDRAALETAWSLGVTVLGHSDYPLKVPFFLNLYDSGSGRPIWAYGAPRPVANNPIDKSQAKLAKSNPANPGLLIHGGVHPGSASQYLY